MERVGAVTKDTGQHTSTSRPATVSVARGAPKGMDEDYRGTHDQGVAPSQRIMNPNMAQYIIGARHQHHSNTLMQLKKRGSYTSPCTAPLGTCQELLNFSADR